MKVKLQIRRGGVSLHEGTYEVSEADSFGHACAHAWQSVHEKNERKATSIGALMEVMAENVLDELDGADIRVSRIR